VTVAILYPGGKLEPATHMRIPTLSTATLP